MTDGLVLPPGAGQRLQSAGMTLKVGTELSPSWSVFEADVPPGFDVGAHRHGAAEEIFYILDGELDLLAFEPLARTVGHWRRWEGRDGQKIARGGPGSLMFVPPGCPHAFANPGSTPARMLFVVAPSGHEHYLRELGELLAGGGGPPDQAQVAALRARHDIEQLTPLVPGLPTQPVAGG
ncbi:cupin domain-containing protein [Frankia sp. CNm7]|uniref:Cupin domain-containing protein n=1 Tax=Frankia nepalensis TaxID=1836974 RepID=A0A937RD37_9ACTN|nr:cupin domain-containing protein [Frankia nepalensis]MBL7497102.1 cupin domain-containing protein [Frankia nepalensis]MBL7510774.1 cupin domain-containing protein [Frankia nepalensis]MBL7521550.1 cupin domain-containing protein [Frankia nepalensis]MBL7626785.1 cupin domain-containing protein [Frankia nepalensis]